MQGKATHVTPASKKASKREQSAAKKFRQVRKNGLLQYFEDGLHVQSPSMEGTPINAVKMRREKRAMTQTPQRSGIQKNRTKLPKEKSPNQMMRNQRQMRSISKRWRRHSSR